MTKIYQSLSNLLAEEEAQRLIETKAEIAAEIAAFNALTPEQQAVIIAEREAKWERLIEAYYDDNFDTFDDEDGEEGEFDE